MNIKLTPSLLAAALTTLSLIGCGSAEIATDAGKKNKKDVKAKVEAKATENTSDTKVSDSKIAKDNEEAEKEPVAQPVAVPEAPIVPEAVSEADQVIDQPSSEAEKSVTEDLNMEDLDLDLNIEDKKTSFYRAW